jgi:hypothetical protein
MSDRKKLDREIARVQRDLNRWAQHTGQIERGQRIVFSARIVGVGQKARLAKERHLKMNPRDFFSAERLLEAGLSRRHSTILSNACLRACFVDVGTRDEPETMELETMRRFLVWYPSTKAISSGIKRIGPRGFSVIVKMIRAAGLEITDNGSYWPTR